MKIKQKIQYSFILMIAITAALGLFSYYLLSKVQNDLFPIILANEKITSYMLETRKHEKDFLLRSTRDPNFFKSGESKYLSKFHESFAKLEVEEEKVHDFFGGDARGEVIDTLLEQYNVGFFKVVSEIKKRGYKDWGLIGSLRKDIHALEKSLANEEEALHDLLSLRKHEKDYLLRKDTIYFDKAVKLADTMRKSLKSSVAKKLLSAYVSKLNEIVLIDEKIGRTAELGVMGQYRKTIQQLDPAVQEQRKLLVSAVDSTVNNNLILILVGIIFSVIIAFLLAIKLSKDIATPLIKMSDVGNRVAGGEIDAVIPVVDTKDEVYEIGETMKLLIGALKFHKTKNY